MRRPAEILAAPVEISDEAAPTTLTVQHVDVVDPSTGVPLVLDMRFGGEDWYATTLSITEAARLLEVLEEVIRGE